MDTSSVPLKRCSRKENCVNPLGSWIPSTPEYFYSDSRLSSGFTSACKACRQAKDKHYNATHKQEKSEYNHQYRTQNRERLLAANKTSEGRAKNAARQREYRAQHPDLWNQYKEHHREEILQQQSEYRKANRQVIVERSTRWRLNNREKHNAIARNRHARKRNAPGKHTSADIQIQYRSQSGRCWWCGKSLNPLDYHVDHRIPLSRGGSNAPENLCVSCPTCNMSKSDKLPHEWSDRLL